MQKITLQDADKLENDWGAKHCDHPNIAKETFCGGTTGDYRCTSCGKTISEPEWKEIKNKYGIY